MKTIDESDEYQQRLEEVYPYPQSAKRFVDAVWEVRSMKELVKIHSLYAKKCNLDLLCILFKERKDVRKYFHDVDEKTYRITNNSKVPSPIDIGMFIDNCVQVGFDLTWDDAVFKDYFL